MFIFKSALFVFLSSYIITLCNLIVRETNSLQIGLVCLYGISGVFAGKILYDRYQHINILGSLTLNPNVTSYVNKIASTSASLLSLGFLAYLILFLFEVNEQSLKALNILLCGIGSLYMWVQCLLTTYLSTLYYDKRLTVCRLCLANVSFLFLVVLALFGTVSVFLPTDSSSGIYMCNIIASISSYVMTTIFCTFILSYEKEYKYFSEGIRSDMLIDDACSLNNASLDDVDSILRTEEPTSSTNATKRRVPCAVLS
ncbi:uncharacterized protein LOC126975330 [Leptidea sinapis]|uniref:uncharacterized protein LOC126975330 n=1 Tax=Leptidea sinapis TaxID=189913 RepID=UPI002124B8EB|nr:uncharacterized protein LOC126975330 [Leptidea sinapis]